MEETAFTPVKKPSLGTRFIKRAFDICSSGAVILVLIPFFILFTPIVAIAMKGNPFFVQKRPGKDGKIFKLIKYRTMTNAKDKEGNLLPDADRLTKFGKFMRSTSLDELPELFCIFIGTMSVVGPRPLLVSYLPYYTEYEMHRHDVRPGLTGLAQIKGRNNITWEEKFSYDIEYINTLTFIGDLKIIFNTVLKVLKHQDVVEDTSVSEGNFAEIRSESLKNAG
ncbi:MAG: sugar transferase [Clostridia bacterium]|nr:sugar transferase [Clostridia bacterium]